MSDSIRDALSKALDAPTEDAQTEAPAEQQAVEAAQEEPQAAPADSRARDEHGRFAPKADETEAVSPAPDAVVAAATIGTPPPEAPKEPELRAPQSLTPAEREEFRKAPIVVQQAILRRERETSIGLQEASRAKQFQSQFQQAIEPYAGFIRETAGGDPVRAVRGLLQTAHSLSSAPAPARAQLMARLIKTYGVDVSLLDEALAGGIQSPSAQPQFDREEILREAEDRARKAYETQAFEAQRSSLAQQVEKFASDHEFYEDVRETMGKLIQAGLASDLESAYKDACARDESVSKILAQREASKRAATGNTATQRAKAAAAPLRAQPAPAVSAGKSGGDRRSDIEAAFESLSGVR